MTFLVYFCKDCNDFFKGIAAAKVHLQKRHGISLKGYNQDYVNAMMDIHFKIPVQAYRIKDKSLMIKVNEGK
jgi:hypothetical protein